MNSVALGRTQVSKFACSSLNLRVARVASHLRFEAWAKNGSSWSCIRSNSTLRCSVAGAANRSDFQAGQQSRTVAKFRLNATPGTTALGNDDQGFEGDQNVAKGWEQKVGEYGEAISLGFLVWVAVASILALLRPQAFLWVNSQVQFLGIVLTMLGMGMTLSFKDFEGALTMPKQLVAGVVLQYTVMPAAGVLVAKLLQLPAHYTSGLVLVACCPGLLALSP